MAEKFLSGVIAQGSGVVATGTGATAAVALRGGVISAAPTTGTFAVGDAVIGQNGAIFICTSAGTPGTWASIFPINFATTPSALGTAAVGTASTAARADHVHAMPNVDVLANVVIASKASGDVLTWDGAHWINAVPSGGSGGSTPLASAPPPAIGTAAVGTSTFAARGDHVHAQQAAVQPTGLAGSGSQTRFAGGTVSGAPTSGTYAVGDYTLAQDGKFFICITAGSPGTWVTIGQLGSTAGAALGTAAAGTATTAARSDHVHALPTLNSLSNVTITSLATGQTLNWNGTAWVNSTPAGASATALQRVVYASGAYPTRPVGVPNGLVDYLGPVAPTDALSNDTWTDNS